MRHPLPAIPVLIAFAFILCPAQGADEVLSRLDARFGTDVRPFLQTYCVACHGQERTEADLDLNTYSSTAAVLKDSGHWGLLLERLKVEDMPPKKAKLHPPAADRRRAIDWFQALYDHETRRRADDPGLVLARRLSNAEYDNTIRDLTGIDIRPTRQFPVDPANTAGFANSGESLTMSPALLTKYLEAAREVANHLVLKPEGFAFAPHTMLAETDRDRYCVFRIIDLYHWQNTDYADYFRAAWRYKHRAALGKPSATLAETAAEGHVSPKYLATVRAALEDTAAEVGPLAKLQAQWRELPAPDAARPDAARNGCEQMRDYVVRLRKKVEKRFLNISVGGGRGGNGQGGGSQIAIIWKNVQYATHRRDFDPSQLQVEGEGWATPADPVNEPNSGGEFGPGKTQIVKNIPGDPDLVVPAGQREKYEAAFAEFCRVFPDMFYKDERGRNYHDTSKDRGRYLSAGFHSQMGYFRDDQALYELILDDAQQKELDRLWLEFDTIAAATARMYIENQSNRPGRNAAAEGDKAEDRELTSETRLKRQRELVLSQARGTGPVAVKAVEDYFDFVNGRIRLAEKTRLEAEPGHLAALLDFAARAYRRPLSQDMKDDLLGYYRSCREKDGLDHEAAVRESVVAVLMSPDLCYRIDLTPPDAGGIRPLSDYELASRLSYFLWSSLPDEELLARAAAGDLHRPEVIAAQVRRMLKDPRVRALAVEFGGNWLDIRYFEDINTVDRGRYPNFDDGLKAAMFEEPVRFLTDAFRANRPVLDLLYANDTFVNPVLAKHYGMPVPAKRPDEWVRVPDANRYDRGGLLPMAAFQTRNAPGLRTSPVKRGNWVVKNVLGERIPAPPPTVPQLPQDEAKSDLPLRDLLARHRADANCAACHARFDSFGLVFEGFGPIGERREKDLAGRAIDASATFPDGSQGTGVEGLRKFIRDHRQNDFVANLSGKLVAYALGRSLIPSDELLIRELRDKLAADGYRFGTLIEGVVTSKQFLTKRGRDDLAER